MIDESIEKKSHQTIRMTVYFDPRLLNLISVWSWNTNSVITSQEYEHENATRMYKCQNIIYNEAK